MEDAVAQCPGGGLGLLAVQREKLEPGAKVVAVSQAALTFVSWEGSRPIPDALLSRLDAGVLAVPGVEVGDLTAATVGGEGPVADLLLDLVVGGALEAAGGAAAPPGDHPMALRPAGDVGEQAGDVGDERVLTDVAALAGGRLSQLLAVHDLNGGLLALGEVPADGVLPAERGAGPPPALQSSRWWRIRPGPSGTGSSAAATRVVGQRPW